MPALKKVIEVRTFVYAGLMCPNPTEYYRMTRTYEQMKAEHNLLTCNEVTKEDVMKVAVAMAKTSQSAPIFPNVAFALILLEVLWLLTLSLL